MTRLDIRSTERLDTRGAARIAAFLALAALFLPASCTANGGAIFATIEQEEETVSSNLSKTATVQDVIPLSVDGGTAFLAVSLTPQLGVQGDSWTEDEGWKLAWNAITCSIETEAGSGEFAVVSGCALLSAVQQSGVLYAVITVPTDEAGSTLTSLFSSAPPSTLATDATPTLEWSYLQPATAPEEWSAQTPEGVLLVNDELFVSARMSSALALYALYHLDVTAGTLTALLDSSSAPPTDGACDAGGTYWFVAGVALYSGDLTSGLAAVTDTAIATTVSYGGIFADSAGLLHLSTRDGRIMCLSGGTWTSSDSLTWATDNAPLAFSDFMGIGDTVYVGSERRGFFSLDEDGLLTDATLAASRMPFRTISDLYAGTVRSFAYVPGEAVFVCTSGVGLWHQKLTSAADTDVDSTSWVWD